MTLPESIVAALDRNESTVHDLTCALFDTQTPGVPPSIESERHALERTAQTAIGSTKPPTVDTRALSQARPTSQSWAEFMGPRWDWERSGLVMPEWKASRLAAAGYAYVFTSGWRGAQPDTDALFREINAALFSRPIGDPEVRVWKWPGGWSSFFDEGWPSEDHLCWTLWMPPSRLLCILASMTD